MRICYLKDLSTGIELNVCLTWLNALLGLDLMQQRN